MSETGIEELVSDDLVKDLFDPEKRSAIQPKLRAIMAPIQAPDYAEGARLKLKECYKYLSKNSVTGDKIAVMGFCFGGTYSFETAMIEPELKAAVPFYGHAAFSVDQLKAIKCPILAFYGEKDENLISQLPEVDANMKKAGVNFRKVVYPGCGHAFFNDTNPYTYNADAAKDAWQKTLAFLSSSFQD
jgi:carboxymethylenebutenolidase